MNRFLAFVTIIAINLLFFWAFTDLNQQVFQYQYLIVAIPLCIFVVYNSVLMLYKSSLLLIMNIHSITPIFYWILYMLITHLLGKNIGYYVFLYCSIIVWVIMLVSILGSTQTSKKLLKTYIMPSKYEFKHLMGYGLICLPIIILTLVSSFRIDAGYKFYYAPTFILGLPFIFIIMTIFVQVVNHHRDTSVIIIQKSNYNIIRLSFIAFLVVLGIIAIGLFLQGAGNRQLAPLWETGVTYTIIIVQWLKILINPKYRELFEN